MGFYDTHILPRGIDWCMSGKDFKKLRQQYLANAHGRVLEVGFGSGLNLPHYPDTVTHLYALDPSLTGRKLAAKRIKRCPFPIEFIDLDGETIPLPDHHVDFVTSTWTLCTIPDPAKALKEIKRVLKPDGRYLIIEHGLSPDAGIAKWQNRFNPIQKWLAGGCNLNRKIDQLIIDAGFEFEKLETFNIPVLKLAAWTFAGSAAPKEQNSAHTD